MCRSFGHTLDLNLVINVMVGSHSGHVTDKDLTKSHPFFLLYF